MLSSASPRGILQYLTEAVWLSVKYSGETLYEKTSSSNTFPEMHWFEQCAPEAVTDHEQVPAAINHGLKFL